MLAPLALALFGDTRLEGELPPLSELGAALASLAEASRVRVLLPSVVSTLEVALVRSHDGVRVSLYDTGTVPEVLVRNRSVSLRAICEVCAVAARALARADDDPLARVAERLAAVQIARLAETREVIKRGGTLSAPEDAQPLAFGFEASIRPAPLSAESFALRADVHALLFEGTLWAFVRGRRIELYRGAILLAVQRMITAARTLLEARERGRAANVRLRSGSFAIGVRLERGGDASVALGEGNETLTAAALDVPGAVLPMLRIAADLVRALIAVDREQTRNLRVRAMRAELRALRKMLRSDASKSAFVNRDPERLMDRASKGDRAREVVPSQPHGALRFVERYRIVLDELDASATFLCGDRIVASTPKRTIAIARDTGEPLWVRDGTGMPAFMAGTVLVRPAPDGHVELCDVADGEAYASLRVSFRGGTPPTGLFAGGDTIPPMLVLHEAPSRIVAIDLRTGEPRFRFGGRNGSALTIRKAGRLLLVASCEGTLDAVDLGSGEVVWRFTDHARFVHPATATREHVVIASGEPGVKSTRVYGVELYSGLPAWRREIDEPLAAPPLAAGDRVLVATGRFRKSTITSLDAATGEPAWSAPDPGLGIGGAWMTVDRLLIVNAPNGAIRAIDLDDGSTRWTRPLAHPLESDVPRKLEPVLRAGALFVPAAQVHVLRPCDGTPHGAPLPCDLVPDLLRVDERGWVYVAEESGHLAAYAPAPHLTLVRA